MSLIRALRCILESEMTRYAVFSREGHLVSLGFSVASDNVAQGAIYQALPILLRPELANLFAIGAQYVLPQVLSLLGFSSLF
jgi:hypothetical protein